MYLWGPSLFTGTVPTDGIKGTTQASSMLSILVGNSLTDVNIACTGCKPLYVLLRRLTCASLCLRYSRCDSAVSSITLPDLVFINKRHSTERLYYLWVG